MMPRIFSRLSAKLPIFQYLQLFPKSLTALAMDIHHLNSPPPFSLSCPCGQLSTLRIPNSFLWLPLRNYHNDLILFHVKSIANFWLPTSGFSPPVPREILRNISAFRSVVFRLLFHVKQGTIYRPPNLWYSGSCFT